ncbi:Arg81p SCDLUD_001313 [Saccharomycodes ludwigii]|uniref:Arg81p n=1 Tax=Saccharomycodes ludwigii TaxID=36035 RepID=UPI001E8C7DB3|nr:hypothetical protein SCDLUD_001313 [Saccharomycodes ludwigii]KAH3903665.1 hypothetical protein SCDLUD_001313 [Saccharomycodes ludwigii]
MFSNSSGKDIVSANPVTVSYNNNIHANVYTHSASGLNYDDREKKTDTKKRSKTFTGCWTCRSRKVKCDLQKPNCQRCVKSNLNCGGYDIKLRWSPSIKFDKYGYPKNEPSKGVILDSDGNIPQFQRRKIAFVRYKEEYQFYDEMDTELSELNAPTLDKIANNNTWIIKKFGVFRGTVNANFPYKPKLKRKNKDGGYNSNDVSNKKQNLTASDKDFRQEAAQPAKRTKSIIFPDFNFDFNNPHGTEWISDELRDDAILTASAVQGRQLNYFKFDTTTTTTTTANSNNTSNLNLENINDPFFLIPDNYNTNNNSMSNIDTNNSIMSNSLNDKNNINNTNQLTNHIYPILFHQHTKKLEEPFNNSNLGNTTFKDKDNMQGSVSNTTTFDNSHVEDVSKKSSSRLTDFHVNQNSSKNIENERNTDGYATLPYIANIIRQQNFPYDISNPVVPLGNSIAIHAPGEEAMMPKQLLEVVHSPIPSEIMEEVKTNSLLKNIPTTGLTSHGLTRFLLNYYMQNVADLMTVFPLTSNPWKTIYFPRALKALGDLVGMGYTSNSRNALLNALLAVSCFNLQSKFVKNSNPMKFFLHLGINFRSQAWGFLELCLKTTVNEERYKDVLTAILSMNTIDVVWGTMADCQRNMEVCEDFVEKRMKVRPKLSEKTKSLHRIFSFLKIIQDSTALDKVKDKEITITEEGHYNGESISSINEHSPAENNRIFERGSGANGVGSIENNNEENLENGQFKEILSSKDGRIHIEFVKQQYNDDATSAKYSSPGTHSNLEKQSTPSVPTPIFNDITSFSHYYYYPKSSNAGLALSEPLNINDLYGLPNSIILLFSDCVKLVRHKEYYSIHCVKTPEKFEYLCKKFEKRLFSWKSEWKFFKNSDNSSQGKENNQEFVSDIIEGAYHHTMSFYYSLIIYYFNMLREINNELLRGYVEKVLYHLERMADLVENKNVKILPLIWQAFIAGCSAIDQTTQQKYRIWMSKLGSGCWGMGSYWGARQIMFEVWRRREIGESNDDWYSVYKDWEMNLMLI